MVTWRYPDEIKERLVKPHQYTRVLLEMSSQMRSYSAAVLYEIGARYLTSPGRLSMREDVVWWAAVLTGRSDIKEVDYRFLKRDVISKALAEIDALCEDFGLELIEHKRGRKIEEIQFRVVPKVQQRLGDISASNRNVFDLALVGRLIALGLKQDEAQDLYATTDEGQIRATLDHVDQRLRNASMPVLKSPAAYFKDALKKGYAGVTAMEPAPSSGPAPALAPPVAVLSEADRLRRIRELWENDRMGQARAVFAEMPQPMQAEVRTRFEAERLDQVAAPIARLAARRPGEPRGRDHLLPLAGRGHLARGALRPRAAGLCAPARRGRHLEGECILFVEGATTFESCLDAGPQRPATRRARASGWPLAAASPARILTSAASSAGGTGRLKR